MHSGLHPPTTFPSALLAFPSSSSLMWLEQAKTQEESHSGKSCISPRGNGNGDQTRHTLIIDIYIYIFLLCTDKGLKTVVIKTTHLSMFTNLLTH
jgi:hypothetical protein